MASEAGAAPDMGDSGTWARGGDAPGVEDHPTAGPGPAPDDPLTVGVEEEYLLVDPASRHLSPQAEKVVAAAATPLGDRVTTELTRFQVEARTDPHTDLADLGQQIRSLRAAVAHAAEQQGLRIVSSGTPVLGHPVPPPFTDGARYARSVETFRALDDEQSVCACHIHVGVPDLTTALRVSNHVRPWLPLLAALAANSPYWAGRDTGYASWRTISWGRWPVAGPPPYFESRSHFEDLVDRLVTTGTILDRGGLYWDIRPSHHQPTLELRVADATATADDTALIAGLVRAMVATALRAIEAGEPPPRPSPEMLRAACWRAARDGLAGEGIDPVTGRLSPAAAQVDRLLARLRPALRRHGDLDRVSAGWSRLRAGGNGADRQRAAHRRRGRLADVVDHLISTTAPAGRGHRAP
ncbi:carboxylate-amine ligase [Streptomyces sp. URMC 123]|uniref:carboxylate-amine ligase n=1 Tax=Streptomyces sp. URMC 123 TaxID=3423403 RepID=UPI003F198AA5